MSADLAAFTTGDSGMDAGFDFLVSDPAAQQALASDVDVEEDLGLGIDLGDDEDVAGQEAVNDDEVSVTTGETATADQTDRVAAPSTRGESGAVEHAAPLQDQAETSAKAGVSMAPRRRTKPAAVPVQHKGDGSVRHVRGGIPSELHNTLVAMFAQAWEVTAPEQRAGVDASRVSATVLVVSFIASMTGHTPDGADEQMRSAIACWQRMDPVLQKVSQVEQTADKEEKQLRFMNKRIADLSKLVDALLYAQSYAIAERTGVLAEATPATVNIMQKQALVVRNRVIEQSTNRRKVELRNAHGMS